MNSSPFRRMDVGRSLERAMFCAFRGFHLDRGVVDSEAVLDLVGQVVDQPEGIGLRFQN